MEFLHAEREEYITRAHADHDYMVPGGHVLHGRSAST